jgi:thiol-disulfide isomerase/thioredoxin
MVWKSLLILGVVTAASIVYVILRRREGRVTLIAEAPGALSSVTLGATLGYRATFVQFSTDTCAKCPPTAALLRRVAESIDGVRHVEIDAAVRLDLARRLGIFRTPTILILNNDGRVVARISGPPSESQARESLDAAPRPSTDYSI